MRELTIVINTYDMQREAPRTLRSVLPPLQKAVSSADYEVIVIDNGAKHALSLAGVDFAGIDVRLFRVPTDASHSSPVFAINDCISHMANGRFVMVCIDGARMFSPYVVRRTLDALNRMPNSFTYVGSRHLGSDVQMKSTLSGYGPDQEDTLLQSVNWTQDLDRLNEISVWAGAHKYNNAFTQNESNAFALQRSQWQETGGYNSRFVRSGGGLCNLEIFKRLVERPDARNILLWGETTFHQVHGGAATSNAGYFSKAQEEFKQAVGTDYQLPCYNFEVDKGIAYGREAAIGKWYCK